MGGHIHPIVRQPAFSVSSRREHGGLTVKRIQTYLRGKRVDIREGFASFSWPDLIKRKAWWRKVGRDDVQKSRKSLFELTAEDLLGLPSDSQNEDAPPEGGRLGARLGFEKARRWCRERKRKLESLRRQSTAVLVRSKLAFGIIVFVGIATALQLIPHIIRFFI